MNDYLPTSESEYNELQNENAYVADPYDNFGGWKYCTRCSTRYPSIGDCNCADNAQYAKYDRIKALEESDPQYHAEIEAARIFARYAHEFYTSMSDGFVRCSDTVLWSAHDCARAMDSMVWELERKADY